MTDLLLVDSNSQRRVLVWDRLTEEGYCVQQATGRCDGLARALSGGIDLVLLDAALADGDGIRLCQELREQAFQGGIVLLIGPERTQERVAGLKVGADDVLTRPFELIELLARIEACLRRRRRSAPIPVGATRRLGGVEVNLDAAFVSRDGRVVAITPREFQVLRCLLERAGEPVSRADLLDHVWGRDSMACPQTVDVHIAGLRRKVETHPRRPSLILTVHGCGYMLADPALEQAAAARVSRAARGPRRRGPATGR